MSNSVIIFSGIILIELYKYEPFHSNIYYNLSSQTKEFYADIEEDEEDPIYIVSFYYDDETKKSIRFPLLDESIDKIDFEYKLKNLADEDGKTISEDEIEEFVNEVYEKNRNALLAKAEFESEISKSKFANDEEIKSTILTTIAVLFIPPLIILMLGYGIAWVREGFKLKK
jgi:hypothetical protein